MHRAFLSFSAPHKHPAPIWMQLFKFVFVGALFLLFFGVGCLFSPPNLLGWTCVSNDECLGELVCRNQKCVRECTNDGDCQGTGSCRAGVCSQGSGDAGGRDGFCIPKAEVCNGLDDNCNGQKDEGLRCVDEGGECDPNATIPISCKAGLICLTYYPDRPKICLRPCTQNQPGSCKDSRFQCLPTPSKQWACLQSKCNTAQDCNYNQTTTHECANIGGNDKFCLPTYPPGGTLTFGNICAPSSTPALYCNPKENLGCWRQDSASQGLCTLRCQSDQECEKLSGGKAKCKVFSKNISTIKVCAYPCDNQQCPQGMKCDDRNVCVVP